MAKRADTLKQLAATLDQKFQLLVEKEGATRADYLAAAKWWKERKQWDEEAGSGFNRLQTEEEE